MSTAEVNGKRTITVLEPNTSRERAATSVSGKRTETNGKQKPQEGSMVVCVFPFTNERSGYVVIRRSNGGFIPPQSACLHASVPYLRKSGGPVPQHRVRVSLEDPTGQRRVRLTSVGDTETSHSLIPNRPFVNLQ